MNTINGSSLFTAFTSSLARLIVFIHVQKKKNAVMQLSYFTLLLPLCSLSHKLCWLLRTFLTNIVLIQQRTLDHAFPIHLSDQRTQFATWGHTVYGSLPSFFTSEESHLFKRFGINIILSLLLFWKLVMIRNS